MPLVDHRPANIAVFRALQVGDMLCAVPALRALRASAPQSAITLVSLPWAREMALRLPHYIDDFIAFPGHPALPEQDSPAPAARRAFLDEVQGRHFNLAIQLHGDGSITNAVVADFGAANAAGYGQPSADSTVACMPYPDDCPEVVRHLRLMEFLGAPSVGDDLEFTVWQSDREDAKALLAPLGGRPYVCVHPGARFSSRRWPAARFAAVADHLAATGVDIVVTGSASERALASSVAGDMAATALDLSGRTTLGSLAAVLEGAELTISNDTGVSHLAAAIGAPSVIISSGSDAERWAPLNTELHRTIASYPACRPCDYVDCPIAGHPCATAVQVDDVLAEAEPLLAASRRFRVVSA